MRCSSNTGCHVFNLGVARRQSPGEGIHELLKPVLGILQNRLTVAGKENVEVESQERSDALTETRWIVHYLVGEQFALARRIADHRISGNQDFPFRPMQDNFAGGFSRRSKNGQWADRFADAKLIIQLSTLGTCV